MIETKKEYDDVISSYDQYIKWFKTKFLVDFSKRLNQLDLKMNEFVKFYYKDVMKDINQKVLNNFEKLSSKIIKKIKTLNKHPYPTVIGLIIKDSKKLTNIFEFWIGKFNLFKMKIIHEFGMDSPQLKFIEGFESFLMSYHFNNKVLFEVFAEYLNEPKLKDDFDRKPIGKLILAQEYLLQKEGGITRKELNALKIYSIEEDWNPGLVIKNYKGTFKPKIHFHIYIHHMYKQEYIKEVFTENLMSNIKMTYYRDINLKKTGYLEKYAKFSALVEYFNENINDFTSLLLNYLKTSLKLSYLKSPHRLIRSNFIDVNCCIRDLTSYGAACQLGTPGSQALLVESINKLLINFSLFCVEFAEKNNLFLDKKSYPIGINPINRINIKHWDYSLNKPQLLLDKKNFEKKLWGYFSSIDKKFPSVIYKNQYGGLSTWTHELTHHFDNDNNPNPSLEVRNLYRLADTPRTRGIIGFLCDLRSDSVTQWVDAQIVHKGKQLHNIGISYNGIIFNSLDYLRNLYTASMVMQQLSSNPNYVPPNTLGRVFGNEYYPIGKFYLILYGIFKSIKKDIPYSIYVVRGRYKIFKNKGPNLFINSEGSRKYNYVKKEYEKIFKSFGRHLDRNELNENALENVIINYGESNIKDISKNYHVEKKSYLRDIETIKEKYKYEIFNLNELGDIEIIRKQSGELANLIEKIDYISRHYFWRIGLVYSELKKLGPSSKNYKNMLKKYNLLKSFIIKKDYIFNFITGVITTGNDVLGAGHQIMEEKLYDINEMEKLVEKEIMSRVEIDSSNSHHIGKLLAKKEIYFSFFDQKIVEEVFNEVHNMTSSLEFIRLMFQLDEFFKIPKKLRLFDSEKKLYEILNQTALLEFQMAEQQGFELTKKEIEEFLSNRK